MMNRQHAWNCVQSLRCIMAVCVLVWMWGCSSLAMTPAQKQWACDSAADAAVDRQDWDQAVLGHQAILKQDPGNCLALYHLGYIRGKLGDRIKETALYERAVQCGLDTDDRLFFNMGMAYGEMHLMQKALASFERAAVLNPENADNYFGLGLTAQAAGQYEKAQSALLKAVETDPRHWEARIIVARNYLDRGQLDAARVHLEALQQGIPDNEEVVQLWQTYEDRRVTSYDR